MFLPGNKNMTIYNLAAILSPTPLLCACLLGNNKQTRTGLVIME